MVWTMCSLENLQVKVLSRVVVVFTRANAFMYINLFVKSNNLLKRILTLKISMAYFLWHRCFFPNLTCIMLGVLLGDDLIIILIIKYLFIKFSAPTISFLSFLLAKKLRLWANSRGFTSYGKLFIVRQVYTFFTLQNFQNRLFTLYLTG